MTVPQTVKLARHAGDLDDNGHDYAENLVTAETDTSLVLVPDGVGGVEFVAPTVDPSTFLLRNEGGQDTIKPHGSMGATETIDPTDGNVHTGTLNANCTFTLNPPVGSGAATLLLWVTQDGTGGWNITWPGSVTWDGGTPTPDTTAAAVVRYVLETLDGGTNWVGVMVGGSSGTSGRWELAVITGSPPDPLYADGDFLYILVP